MKKINKFLARRTRMIIVGFFILLQVAFFAALIYNVSAYIGSIYYFFTFLSYLMIFVILYRSILPEFKISWIVLFAIVPLFGGLFYILFGTKLTSKKFINQISYIDKKTKHYIKFYPEVSKQLKQENLEAYKQSYYMQNWASAPVYQNTQTKYLSPGEEKFDYLVQELEKAEKFIFLEYFILEQGVMWSKILNILQKKVAQGVDVRLMYDDIGSVNTLPPKYYQEVEAMGIRCKPFNPFTANLNIIMNHRDHRKIVVIDGHTAFTGGTNIADEYINVKERFGHWKDSSIMIKGDAVFSFTVMFLQFWNWKDPLAENFDDFKPKTGIQTRQLSSFLEKPSGFVQPYSDSPMDDEPVGARVYLNLIAAAKKEICIFTPYFIVDSILMESLCLSAKNGVDVKIVVPHIPDKKTAFLLTRSHYKKLLQAGVSVYEYTPGFIHSKCVMSDREIGVVGTVNFDYRSLYHHFECGVWMYKTKALEELALDFDKTIEMSEKMTMDFVKAEKWYYRVLRAIIKVFAPLM